VKEGQCQVTLKTRKNCQACRYKLCEAAGMKTTWVLTEEERKTKFDGKSKKRRSSSVGQSDHNCIKIKTDDNAHLSEDDIANISNYVAASDYWEISKVNDMNTELIRKIIRYIMSITRNDNHHLSQNDCIPCSSGPGWPGTVAGGDDQQGEEVCHQNSRVSLTQSP